MLKICYTCKYSRVHTCQIKKKKGIRRCFVGEYFKEVEQEDTCNKWKENKGVIIK